jgi:hypothetical protein
MFNILYIEKKNRHKDYILDSKGHSKYGNINKSSQHHYQNISWTDINCRAVWKFADYNDMRDHLLQQRQLLTATAKL